MVCARCGTRQSETALFCSQCGASLEKPLAVAAQVPESQLSTSAEIASSEDQTALRSSAKARGRSRRLYIWLVVELAFVMIFIVEMAFSVTLAAIAGGDSGMSQVQLLVVPLFAMGYAAKRSWESLLTKEPEWNPAFRQKHRKFQVVGAWCFVILLGAALGLGVIDGRGIARNNRREALLKQLAEQGPKNAEVRQRLNALFSQKTSQPLELTKVLNDYDLNFRRNQSLLNSLATEAADMPTVVEGTKLLLSINEKDKEVLDAMRAEIAQAESISKLPQDQHLEYYKRTILPIETKMDRLVEEEKALILKAQQKGLKLPFDPVDSIKGK